MGEALLQMYETLDEESQKEAYNFVAYLVYRQGKKKTASQEHIDKFFGIIDDETAKTMLEASQECRRIEPDEWYDNSLV